MIEISVNNLAYSTNRYVAVIFLIPICDSENWNLHDNVLLFCCIIYNVILKAKMYSDPKNVKVSMKVSVCVLVCVFRPDVAVCFEK